MTIALGSAFGDFKAYFEYTTSSTNTKYSIKVTNAGMYQSCTYASYPWKTTMTATSYDSRSGTDATTTTGKGYHSILEDDKTYSYTRKTSAYTVTIKATTKKNVDGGSSGSVSKTFTIPALTKYTVSYDANNGSGAPSNQTKYYGKTLTLSSTVPTRTGYSFKGWATSATGDVAYMAGTSYTTNSAVTLYAVWESNTYTVSLNPNGGTFGSEVSVNSSGEASLTKVGNASVILDGKYSPARSGYGFKGWATSPSATSPEWIAGATFSETLISDITLYAVWGDPYTLPTITKVIANRVSLNEESNTWIENDDGTYGSVIFTWSPGTTSGANITPTSIKVYCKLTDDSTSDWFEVYSVSDYSSQVITTGGFKYNDQELSIDSQYDIKVVIIDENCELVPVVKTTFISKSLFVIDVKADGEGLSIGSSCTDKGFSVAWNTHLKNGLSVTSAAAGLNNCEYGVNKVLASCKYWMTSSTTVTLSEPISAQPHGVVLVFSSWSRDNNSANDYNWNHVFVPKYTVSAHGGKGYNFLLTSSQNIKYKYIFINDTYLTGYASSAGTEINSSSSFTVHGKEVDQGSMVLRYVIGV